MDVNSLGSLKMSSVLSSLENKVKMASKEEIEELLEDFSMEETIGGTLENTRKTADTLESLATISDTSGISGTLTSETAKMNFFAQNSKNLGLKTVDTFNEAIDKYNAHLVKVEERSHARQEERAAKRTAREEKKAAKKQAKKEQKERDSEAKKKAFRDAYDIVKGKTSQAYKELEEGLGNLGSEVPKFFEEVGELAKSVVTCIATTAANPYTSSMVMTVAFTILQSVSNLLTAASRICKLALKFNMPLPDKMNDCVISLATVQYFLASIRNPLGVQVPDFLKSSVSKMTKQKEEETARLEEINELAENLKDELQEDGDDFEEEKIREYLANITSENKDDVISAAGKFKVKYKKIIDGKEIKVKERLDLKTALQCKCKYSETLKMIKEKFGE